VSATVENRSEVFGDDTVAAAMIDRLVHHADVIALKGDSYRLKDRDLGRVPAASTEQAKQHKTKARGSVFNRRQGVKIRDLTRIS
jgi:IstB-like ATP binding protein